MSLISCPRNSPPHFLIGHNYKLLESRACGPTNLFTTFTTQNIKSYSKNERGSDHRLANGLMFDQLIYDYFRTLR